MILHWNTQLYCSLNCVTVKWTRVRIENWCYMKNLYTTWQKKGTVDEFLLSKHSNDKLISLKKSPSSSETEVCATKELRELLKRPNMLCRPNSELTQLTATSTALQVLLRFKCIQNDPNHLSWDLFSTVVACFTKTVLSTQAYISPTYFVILVSKSVL